MGSGFFTPGAPAASQALAAPRRPLHGCDQAPLRGQQPKASGSAGGSLLDALRRARQLNNVIVILVDPWSVRLPEWDAFLRACDAEEFANAAVLVSWNPKDTETVASMNQLKGVLDNHFRGRRTRKEFHEDPVSSREEIEHAVMEGCTAVQARLIELGRIPPAGGGEITPLPILKN